MRVAAVAVALVALAGCGGPSTTTWAQPADGAEPAVSVLPAGLVALAATDDGPELRVHDATRGELLRTISVPAEDAVFSPSFAYAADIDSTANLLRIHKLQGIAYEPVTSLNAGALGAPGRTMTSLGFIADTGRLGVAFDGAPQRTVLLDPADPGPTLAPYTGDPENWDSHGGAAAAAYVPLKDFPAARNARVRASARELLAAEVLGPDGESTLYSCSGRQIGPFSLVCTGTGKRAEIVAVTTDPAGGPATLRRIASLKGKPFTRALVSPDGKRLLAQRPDGFYATAVTGGKPQRAFTTLGDVTLLTWN